MGTTTGTGIAFDDVGTGEPALFCLPGWCGNRDVFDPLTPLFAAHRRTIVMDLPGQGGSAPPASLGAGETTGSVGDFGSAEVVQAALDVVADRGLDRVVPVALSHAGWVAIEMRRRLGPERVPGLVLVDWMVLGPPPGFTDALGGLQNPAAWQDVRAGLFGMWTDGLDIPALHAYVATMGTYDAPSWHRAAREIAASFAAEGTPLRALENLPVPCPTLHVYAQPADDAVLTAQQDYAAAHPWFAVHRLPARSHFAMFEVPEELSAVVEDFARKVTSDQP